MEMKKASLTECAIILDNSFKKIEKSQDSIYVLAFF